MKFVREIADVDIRNDLYQRIAEVAEDGDLIFRFGDARHFHPLFGPLGIELRFSELVCKITDPPSPFSHVSILNVEGSSIFVYDMSNEGLRRFFLRDWLLEVYNNGGIEVRSLESGYNNIGDDVVSDVYRLWIAGKTKYDFEFDPFDLEYYCTELAYQLYVRHGAPLPDLVDITKQPGWKWWMGWIAKVGGIDLKKGMVLPGTEEVGMRSAKCLKVKLQYLPEIKG